MSVLRTIIEEAVATIENHIISIECILSSGSERNISDILTEIRALPNVTIVSAMKPTMLAGQNTHVSQIKIKILPKKNVTRRQYLTELHRYITKIPSVIKIKFTKTYTKQTKFANYL